MTATHEPIEKYWPRTETDPAEVHVACSCGEWEFTSQESIGGPVETWGPSFDAHAEDAEDAED